MGLFIQSHTLMFFFCIYFCSCRLMEVTCPDPPLPQDVPPPRDSSPSQDKKASSTTKLKVKHADKNWLLSGPFQELLSSSKLESTMHDVFTEDGRKRVCLYHILQCNTDACICNYLRISVFCSMLSFHSRVDYYKCIRVLYVLISLYID